MQISPSGTSKNKSPKKPAKVAQLTFPAQHGFCILSPDLPPETLNWTTSYLGPRDLFHLSLTCKHLLAHVALDATWRAAFMRAVFRIDPETEPDQNTFLLFKRGETTWKKEYIARRARENRWTWSRSSVVMHSPLRAAVHPMFLMDGGSCLLSASVVYGAVSRSIPSSGKILKGYIDPSGSMNNNNQNAIQHEVSIVALTGFGKTGLVVWGFRSGTVAVTQVPRVAEQPRVVNRQFARSTLEDSHNSSVTSITLSDSHEVFLTGGNDGAVKLWSLVAGAELRVRVSWTHSSPPIRGVPDPCIQVAYHSASGTLAAAFKSGFACVWSGFTFTDGVASPKQAMVIAADAFGASAEQLGDGRGHATIKLSPSLDGTSLLVHWDEDSFFTKIAFHTSDNTTSSTWSATRYADGPLGPLTCIELNTALPEHGSNNGIGASKLRLHTAVAKRSVAVAGDVLGRICVWDWNAIPDGGETKTARSFEAHADGGVSAICISNWIWISGSARGTVHVWDAVTLARLRVIQGVSSGTTGPAVDQILFDEPREVLVVSAGSQIVYWKPGSFGNDKKNKNKSARGGSGNRSAAAEKWHQQMEIKSAVLETRQVLDAERRSSARTRDRHALHQETLSQLGLSEVESLQYAMMLSSETVVDDQAHVIQTAGGSGTSPRLTTPVSDQRASPFPPSPAGRARMRSTYTDIGDEDLEFALRLSLAEAESLRGAPEDTID